MEQSTDKKVSALVLIKTFFGLSLNEVKDEIQRLTQLDIQQLGSAIARQRGLDKDTLKFEMIEY